MRMRHQLIVTIAMVVTMAAFGAAAFAQTRAADHWNENKRAAVVAAWAQPVVVPTTIATADDTVAEAGGDTSALDEDGRNTPPGQEKDKCVPPGQVRRDEVGSDKDTPPGQEKDKCVPPGQTKDKDTPPGLDKDDKDTPPGLDKDDKDTPPGLDKDDKDTPPGLDKDDKDTDKDD